MTKVTKLHLVLILAFAFSLSGLVVELLYLLHCRRRRRRRTSLGLAVDDPELLEDSGAGNDLAPSKWTLLRALCFRKQPSSRVEPAFGAASPAGKPAAVAPLAATEAVEEAATEEDEEDSCDLTLWREMCLGPSRLLYTIQEEEDAASGRHELEARRVGDDDGAGGTPFYTPASSPPREQEQAGEMPPSGEPR